MFDVAAGKKLSADLGFGSIVGQAELKRALLSVGANDALDGLLVRGEKGTAKSTAVRALADLLPEQRAVADCPFGCAPADPARQCADCRERTDPPVERRPVPLVTLPLGATREQVVGTLSVADALDGQAEFDPGLLARANRGILYVDEVNLLGDHLVDVLLDAAASGVNRVERDGVSRTHPAEFTLVGTMNPEEGDLRPQLRDRFALQATVTGCADLDDRVTIIERALGDDQDDTPDGGHADRLQRARELLSDVTLPAEFKRDIAELCRDAGVEGHRADIATARAARTFAALDGRTRVIERDVRRGAELALPHRLQSRPFEDAPDAEDVLDDHFEDDREGDESDGDGDAGDGGTGAGPEQEEGSAGDETTEQGPSGPQPAGGDPGSGNEQGDPSETGEAGAEQDGPESDADDENAEETTPLVPGQARAGVGEGAAPDIDSADLAGADGPRRETGGRATASEASVDEGARVRTERSRNEGSVDAAASVRAAAARGSETVDSRDLRQSVREGDAGALVVFALDASASMRPAMRAARGVALDLLEDAYRQRDEVAVVTFAGSDADVVLPPTDSVTLAARHLKDLPVGDRTPLPAGLRTAGEVLARADPTTGVVVLVTDGRANDASGSPVTGTREAARRLAGQDAHVVVVDAGPDDRSNLAGDVADITDGDRVPLDALTPETVEGAVSRAHGTDPDTG